MTQEQKELLLKDLCGRLPYGVKVELTHWRDRDKGIIDSRVFPFSLNINNANVLIKETTDVKPYLFPLSSMTEEQKRDLRNLFKCCIIIKQYEIDFPNYGDSNMDNWMKVCTWCYKNHIDIYGLIPMGLAEDATGLNIY